MAKRTAPSSQWLVANGLRIIVVNGVAVLTPLAQPTPPTPRLRLTEGAKGQRITESGARRVLENT